ncbi:MAG: reverse transcriptase family protein [Planctomycetota bacterium]
MLLHGEEKELLERSPQWLLLPLPPHSSRNDGLIDQLKRHLRSREPVWSLLSAVTAEHSYPVAANLANALIWNSLRRWCRHAPASLLKHAELHMTRSAEVRVLRRLAKAPNTGVRKNALKRIRQLGVAETMLPQRRPTDAHPWRYGLGRESFFGGQTFRHEERLADLPEIEDIAQLREVLGIRSTKQLGWMLQACEGEGKPYHRFGISKRNGGEREICAPQWQLMHVQQRVLRKILSKVPVHSCAHGFVPGKSVVSNAQPHVGQKLVLKFDLQDFFATISYARVMGLFTSLGYYGSTIRFSNADESHNVAATLARLCVYAFNHREWISAYCPQGAPTSPTISNLICRGLDARCQGLASACSGRYTRYADDLTFSFAADDIDIGRFRWWVDQICHQEGFYVNHHKFRLMRASRRQSVTGIVVNETLRVPREQRRKLRAILHDAETNGLDVAARGRPQFRAWLLGTTGWIQMVDPDEGAALMTRVQRLLRQSGDGEEIDG